MVCTVHTVSHTCQTHGMGGSQSTQPPSWVVTAMTGRVLCLKPAFGHRALQCVQKKNPGSGLDRCTTDSALWLRIEKSPYYDFVHFQTKLASTPPSLFKPITFGNYLRTYDMVSYMKWIDVTSKKKKGKEKKKEISIMPFHKWRR